MACDFRSDNARSTSICKRRGIVFWEQSAQNENDLRTYVELLGQIDAHA